MLILKTIIVRSKFPHVGQEHEEINRLLATLGHAIGPILCDFACPLKLELFVLAPFCLFSFSSLLTNLMLPLPLLGANEEEKKEDRY